MITFADRFVLERELGSGGMARVYLGRDEVLDRAVAVKVLNPVHGGTEIGDRFQREGRTAARLVHPNVVQVYDAGEAPLDGRETSYIVMEYVSGGDLKELIDRLGRLSGPELAGLGGEVCAGLAHAHEHGVIHRDIKPHNILLDEKGHAKVTDFGIARALDTSHATRTGSFLGTALYSSPEQLKGEKVTPKSDVYSLGVTLYQAAAGAAPFSGATPIEIASQHVSGTPIPPRQLGADVDENVQALILDCLAKDPGDRPTADEARSRLETVKRDAPAPPPPPVAPVTTPTLEGQARTEPAASAPGTAVRTQKKGRKAGLLAALAVLAVLAVIGAIAAPNLFGGGGEAGSGNSGENNAQAGGNGEGSGGGGSENQVSQGSGGSASASATASASAEASASAQGSSPEASGEVPKPGVFTASAAENTVQAFYTMTTDGDYEDSARLLSQDWRQDTFPNQAIFEGTFDNVKSVNFIEGPDARVSGNAATVTGETRAVKKRREEHNRGTWYLVREDGRWKIDGWDVVPLDSRPA